MENQRICFLPKESYYSEYFPRHILPTMYLRRGELVTRLLKVDSNSPNSIKDFLSFCGITSQNNDTFQESFANTQKEIKESLQYYLNIMHKTKFYSMRKLSTLIQSKYSNVNVGITSVPNIDVQSPEKVRKKMIKEKDYVLVNQYESNDIFSLVWVELIECFKLRIMPEQCTQCDSYFFYKHNRNCSICSWCIPPSREPAQVKKVKNPYTYQKLREKNTILKYIERNTGNPDKINDYLRKKGLIGKSEDFNIWLKKHVKKRGV